jgi:hypothetical protein
MVGKSHASFFFFFYPARKDIRWRLLFGHITVRHIRPIVAALLGNLLSCLQIGLSFGDQLIVHVLKAIHPQAGADTRALEAESDRLV